MRNSHRISSMVEKIIKSIRSQNIKEIKNNINKQDELRRTALHIAIDFGYPLITIRQLLENGADVNIQDQQKYNALHYAVSAKSPKGVINMLLDKGVNIEARDYYGCTPLLLASKVPDSEEIIEYLLENGANPNAKDDEEFKPILHYSRQQSRFLHDGNLKNKVKRTIKYFVQSGTNINNWGGNFSSSDTITGESFLKEIESEKSKQDQLFTAISKGNIKKVRKIIETNKFNPKLRNEDGCTLVNFALLKGCNEEMINFLIDKGFDVRLPDYRTKQSPLHRIAIKKDFVESASKILKQQINIEAKDVVGNNPIILAAKNNNHKLLASLAKKGANVNVKDKDGLTPLHYAIQNSDIMSAQLLLGEGADIEAKDPDGNAPIILAAKSKNQKLIVELVKKGANVNVKDKDGLIPLHYAIQDSDIMSVQLFVRNGADINIEDKDGSTPNDLVQKSDNNTLKEFFKKINSPLHRAVQKDDIKYILNSKNKTSNFININERNYQGKTPLDIAVGKDKINSKVVEALMNQGANGANIYLKGKVEKSPDDVSRKVRFKLSLHDAVKTGDLKTVKLLLRDGADIDDKDRDGSISLHIAVKRGDFAIVQFLVKNGADINAKDKDGSTPIDLAKGSNNTITQFFKKLNTPIHRAVQKGDISAIANPNNFININKRDYQGKTPLDIALGGDEIDVKVIKALIDQGANPNLKNEDGKTAFDIFNETKSNKSFKDGNSHDVETQIRRRLHPSKPTRSPNKGLASFVSPGQDDGKGR